MDRKMVQVAKKLFLLLVLLIIFGTLSGCASIIKGGKENMTFRSDPEGATLQIYNDRSGEEIAHETTPETIVLNCSQGYFKKALYRVVVSKEGYEANEFSIVGRASGWYVGGNILFGGLIGWLIVDPATGSMWTLKCGKWDSKLNKYIAGECVVQQKDTIRIVLKKVSELPLSMRKELKMLEVLQKVES